MSKKSSRKVASEKTIINFTQLSTAWISFTLAGTVLVLLANLFFPKEIVLGHHMIPPLLGAVYAVGMISLIAVGFMPVIEYLANDNEVELASTHWLAIYWIINAGAVWLVGRLAEVIGLGIGSWTVAIILGLVLDLLQGGLMMHVVNKIKSS